MVSFCVGVWVTGPPATSPPALQSCGGQTTGQFKRTSLTPQSNCLNNTPQFNTLHLHSIRATSRWLDCRASSITATRRQDVTVPVCCRRQDVTVPVCCRREVDHHQQGYMWTHHQAGISPWVCGAARPGSPWVCGAARPGSPCSGTVWVTGSSPSSFSPNFRSENKDENGTSRE